MTESARKVLGHAADVVAQCLDRWRGPAEVMARMPLLGGEPARVRAAVSRRSLHALGALRRLEFALGDQLTAVSPEQRAWLLVAADAVDTGELMPEVAARCVFDGIGKRVALPDRGAVEASMRRIEDPELRFAIEHSIADWLVPHLRQAFGEQGGDVLCALGAPAPRTLRANLLRIGSQAALIERLVAEGIAARPARFAATAVHVDGTADLFRSHAYCDGCFEQQDEASQLAVAATAPPPGGKVLDLCCGSGGKTLALAAALRNRGVVMATDVHAERVAALRRRLPRAGADNVQVLHLDGAPATAAAVERFARRADRILVDAPCTGTGSWRRRPEARWAVDAAGFAELLDTQARLLDRAAGWLQPGARLVYATCSLLPAENEAQVAALLGRHPQLEPVRLVEILGAAAAGPITDVGGVCLSVRPDRHGCDGFFVAVLRRRRELMA